MMNRNFAPLLRVTCNRKLARRTKKQMKKACRTAHCRHENVEAAILEQFGAKDGDSAKLEKRREKRRRQRERKRMEERRRRNGENEDGEEDNDNPFDDENYTVKQFEEEAKRMRKKRMVNELDEDAREIRHLEAKLRKKKRKKGTKELQDEITDDHELENQMFKKFDSTEDVVGSQQLKGSVQKSIRAKLIEQYPSIEPYMESVLPKKENFKLVKCKDHLELIADANGTVQFVKSRDLANYFPTLRLLHKYPFMLPQQQVDKGAIKFVLNGSHIMCPGLTSAGGRLLDDCSEGSLVAIMAEGKQNAVAIGQMKLSSANVRSQNVGIAIDNVHFLNDGLWRLNNVQ